MLFHIIYRSFVKKTLPENGYKTKKTPTNFIRSIRLKRAAQLLEEGHTVAEVADRVGFSTSSYLSKCFQEEFGMRPLQYVNSLKEQPK